jgi:BirA family biotin operon repressor/biotin-[acetyl-CoA-carboxylase] ligase
VRGFETGHEAIPAIWFDELDSTNAEARRRAEAGEFGPIWLASRRQTAGRGRRDRVWQTQSGNLAATLLYVTDLPLAELAQLSFVTAFGVRAMAREFIPESLIRFKWPNDVFVAGEKLSGILLESGRRDDGLIWVAIGVGVNLAVAPHDVERPATSLADHLKEGVAAPPSPEAALEVLSEMLTQRISAWSRSGFEPFRGGWTQGAFGLGEPCVARLGDREITGVAEGLDSDGALLLRLASGELQRITAGDVFFG